MNDSDLWLNAGTAIVANKPPDLKSLVALLRSGKPVPPGIIDMLAEMLDPEGAGYLYFKLKLVNCETVRSNFATDLTNLDIAADYGSLRDFAKSMPSQEAAEIVGGVIGKSDRAVYNALSKHRALLAWLRRR